MSDMPQSERGKKVNGPPTILGAAVTPIATTWILVAVLLTVGIYDVYAGLYYGPEYTVSQVVRDWSGKWPVLPMLVGVLLGHLFWGRV